MKKIILLLALAITGCAASGQKYADMKNEIYSHPPGKSRVVFYRVYKLAAGGGWPPVLIDGEKCGTIKNKGFLFCDLEPGKHTVNVRDYIAELTLTEGELYFIEVNVREDVQLRRAMAMGVRVPLAGVTFVPKYGDIVYRTDNVDVGKKASNMSIIKDDGDIYQLIPRNEHEANTAMSALFYSGK